MTSLHDHREDRRPVVVSVTSLPLEADSRTLKIAASFIRSGYRSIVVEGRASRVPVSTPGLECIAAGPPAAGPLAGRQGSWRNRLVTTLRRGHLGYAGEAALFAAFAWQVRRQLGSFPASRLPRADLFYLHAFDYFPCLRPLLLRDAVPMIYDAHDFHQGIVSQEQLPSFDRRWMMPAFERVERDCVAAAADIVTVSDGVARQIEAKYHRHPHIVRNAHDFRLDRPTGTDIRRQLRLGADDRLLMVVGNYKKGMALPAACDALALLPASTHLALLGRGYGPFAEGIARHPCASRIHLVDAVAPEAIVPFVRTADIGIIPNCSAYFHHTVTNGFFQLAAAGLPLVYGDLTDMRRLAERYGAGVMADVEDPTSLAAAIRRLLEGDAARTAAAGAARLAAENSWETEERRLAGIVAAALGRDSRQTASGD